jgi:fructan beta-fructosidase
MQRKNGAAKASHPELYNEKYRPQLHFSAPENWLNDPNGLVWHDGLFHLFYQYNPTGNDWGNMHWGHAVSRNLMNWDMRPIALHAEPLGLGYPFSGCAVHDRENTSGLGSNGAGPLVVLYTNCTTDGIQSQSLAYSLDDGETWFQYAQNPVVENPGLRDFRDPKVFWHAASNRWVMTLAADDHIEIYASPNLIEWRQISRFGKPPGAHNGVWECPDLFPLQSPDGGTKWVIVVSVCRENSHRAGSVQYFVGDFDGTAFKPQHTEELWIDYGPDAYAAVTWDNVPKSDGRRILIGWMSNWQYARRMPTYPWRGNMTIPRQIALVAGERGYEIAALPVTEIRELRDRTVRIDRALIESDVVQSLVSQLPSELLDIDLVFSWAGEGSRSFGLNFSNKTGEKLVVAVHPARRVLSVDRTTVGQRLPDPDIAGRFEAPLDPIDNHFTLRVIKDRASVEVFGDDGRAVISVNLFFDELLDSVSLFSLGDVEVQGEVSILNSIWNRQ